MDSLKYFACRAIDDHKNELQSLSSAIWHFAEPSRKELKSSQAIRTFLTKKKFIISYIPGLPTGFLAEFGSEEFGGQKRPNIGILCRYDAQQNRGHVKGHNLIAEVAVAAAIGLQEVFKTSTAKLGRVTVIACPDTERGALTLILGRKLLKDVDVVLTAAPGQRTVWCPSYQGSRTLRACYRGHSGNSAKMIPPADALTAAIYAYHNVLAVQQHFGRGWQINGIIPVGGQHASQTLLECETVILLRAPTNRDLVLMEKRVLPCLHAAAKATRCQLTLTFAQRCLYSLINNTMLIYCLQLNAYYAGVLATPTTIPEIMEPVDVGNLSRTMPVIRPIFYIGTDAQVGTADFKKAAHSQEAHDYALAMAKAVAMTAVDLLHTPGTLAMVKNEHRESLQKEKNISFPPFKRQDKVQVHRKVVSAPMPYDTNTGWSKAP